MRQWRALLWLAMRECRWLIVTPLGVFAILAAFDVAAGAAYPRLASTVMAWAGPLVAVALGAAIGAMHLTGESASFWRARPIPAWRLALCRFAVGLVGVLLLAVLPQTPAIWMDLASAGRLDEVGPVNVWGVILCVLTVPLMASLYSTSFLAGVLFREPARAAAPAFALALLVVFLPLIVPALSDFGSMRYLDGDYAFRAFRLSPDHVAAIRAMSPEERRTDPGSTASLIGSWVIRYDNGLPRFLGFSAVLALVAGAGAVVALGRGWRLAADQPVLAWSLAGVVLLLMVITTAQLQSNLEPVAEVEFARAPGASAPWHPVAMDVAGDRAAVLAIHGNPWAPRDAQNPFRFRLSTMRIDTANDRLSELRSVNFSVPAPYFDSPQVLLHSDGRAVLLIQLRDEKPAVGVFLIPLSVAADSDPWPLRAPVATLEDVGRPVRIGRRFFLHHKASGMVELDVSDPQRPTLSEPVASRSAALWETYRDLIREADGPGSMMMLSYVLPDGSSPLGLSQPEHVMLGHPMVDADGDRYAMRQQAGVEVGQIVAVAPGLVRLLPAGRFEPSPLIRVLGLDPQAVRLRGRDVWLGGRLGQSASVVQFRIQPNGRLLRTGHFARGTDAGLVMTLTDDGRPLVATGERAYLLPLSVRE